jgi:hypothetical protein
VAVALHVVQESVLVFVSAWAKGSAEPKTVAIVYRHGPEHGRETVQHDVATCARKTSVSLDLGRYWAVFDERGLVLAM